LTKIKTSVSFRSLSKMLVVSSVYLKTQSTSPSYQTGILWIKKIGYYELYKPKERADDWVIIADESIGIGQEKVLVVLGIRRKDVDFTRPLKLKDLTPLLVKSKERWTGEDIAQQLKIVKDEIGGILYAVTDSCCTLKKGLRESEINHLYDITHSIAIVLEKIYKTDTDFKDLTNRMGQMRILLANSKQAHLIPPNQRSKSRFLNIDIISKWGIKALCALDKENVTETDKQQLSWIKEKQGLIEEMHNIVDVITQISILLKTSGLSMKSKKECISILKTCKKGRMKYFRKHIINYLESNIIHAKMRGEKLLCCSDIIESTFGKYKNEISKNPLNGITDLALIIPAFTSNLSTEEIKTAIDSCSTKKINQWNQANLCESLSIKRNAVFGK
jgi:hypothetical protein